MRIEAITNKGQDLVEAINKAINDNIVKTWEILFNGKKEILYSHTPVQWKEKAMLKPKVEKDKVIFTIVWWEKNGEPSKDIKGYILGRFVEMLMVHVEQYFDYLRIEK